MASNAEDQVRKLLKSAGIYVNGNKSYDLQVHNPKFYTSVIVGRELALGESYMNGWWEVKRLDKLIAKLLEAKLQSKVRISPVLVKTILSAYIFNQQSVTKSKRVVHQHYNFGNDLYERMLDKRMIYSCGYWENANNLDEAQEAKLELICKKLQLKSGMTLLDIGCGWGGFAAYAAEKYNVNVIAITPAEEQVKLARLRCAGLPVTVMLQDYRDISGTYDRITSIGMLEHVGSKNYKNFFNLCKSHLKDDGLMLHHTIANNHTMKSMNPWMDKYIFPGGVIPGLAQLIRALEDELIVEDVHNFGPDYDKTLMTWHNNFIEHYDEIKHKYDERFRRMWEFYLLSSAGMFRSRQLQLYQIVLRKNLPSLTYKSVR